MTRSIVSKSLFSGWTILILATLPLDQGRAVPSFSRQTGVTCASCHTVFPQLTSFGRDFKRAGYTMISTSQGQTGRLEEGAFPPISAMVQSSYTLVKTEVPGSQNGNALLPDQLSLFYAGRISGNLGGFMQITYDGQDDHFSMDNVDIRFARRPGGGLQGLTYGLTLNNNPTVSDLFNSTPAWGFPYASSEIAPAPAPAAQIDGGLAQQVAGLGAYGAWKNLAYLEGTLYRSCEIGAPSPPTADQSGIIKGVTPAWRLALTHQIGEHYIEVGTYGLYSRQFPGNGAALSGETDDFLDTGVDTQIQWLNESHTLTLHSTWIREKQDWNASFPSGGAARASDVLRTFRVDGTYYYDRLIGGSLGYFQINGDSDPLLYPTGAVMGSRTGSPESRGVLVEVDFVPWYNTKLSLHYTFYNRFNGSDSDYDGDGRAAADNNTFYLNVWLMF
jgi:hypothetical protein